MAIRSSPQHMDCVTIMHSLINPDNSCSFTGYRPEKLPWGDNEDSVRCNLLKEKLFSTAQHLVVDFGIRHFICGMARGSDTFFCEAVLLLRGKFPEVTLEAAVPHSGQSSKWSHEDKLRYSALINKCNMITVVSEEYSKTCMMRRNRYMVKNASILIAVFDGKSGGTNNTVKYACHRGLKIIEIVP